MNIFGQTLGFIGNLRGMDILILFVVLALVAMVVVTLILRQLKKNPGGASFPVVPPLPPKQPLAICANCRRVIGDLETKMQYKENHVVCKQCFETLSK